MSEELFQRKSLQNMINIGEFKYLNIGATTFKQLLDLNIISNKIDPSYLLKKPDGLILSGSKQPYKIEAIIENKEPDKFKGKAVRQQALTQMMEYCCASNCNIGAITEGIEYEWFLINSKEEGHSNKIITKNGMEITANPIKYPNNNVIKCKDLLDNKEAQLIASEIIKGIDVESSILNSGKVIVNPTNLAKSIWQSIWLATGDDPKNCLMTFTEIFMYKYLSDLELITTNDEGLEIDFKSTFNKGKSYCLKFYHKNVRNYIKTVFPTGDDGTTIINGLSLKEDKNQDELFYKILEAFDKYGSLKGVSIEFKSSLFEEFLKGSNGIKLMAQFFTPRNVVRAMVDMAQVNLMVDGQSICDPACGVGGFIQEAMIKRNVKNEFTMDNEFNSSLKYYGMDLDKHTIILAKASLTVLLSDYISNFKNDIAKFSKYINQVFSSMHGSTIGSLSLIKNQYDLILSNPPYVRKGLSVYHDFISHNIDLTEYYDVKTNSKEGLFILNIVKSLKAGGKALVVLPDGFFHTKSDKELRDFVIENCYLDAIISLPERTFYTTAKKTYILCITKKKKISEQQTHNVFNYIIRDVGESLDAVRVDTSLKDLNTLVSEYRYFYSNKEDYTNSKSLEQIILIDIEHYKNNNMWMTEQLIDDELKKKLGIKNEEIISSFDDVYQELEEINDSISSALNNIATLENNVNDINNVMYKDVDLGDEDLFEFITLNLGYNQKGYKSISVSSDEGYPLFTAARGPVAYLDKTHKNLIEASEDDKHVSVATDGDGTAGTNIILHQSPYFLNTSRIAIKVKTPKILPEYLYYCMKDIKKRFGFGYTIKCSSDNFKKYFKLTIPVDDMGEFCLETQKIIVDNMRTREALLESLEINILKLKNINDFKKYLSINDL